MTKFGEQLRINCIVQWKDVYVNYALLKRLVKQLRTARSAAMASSVVGPSTPPAARRAVPADADVVALLTAVLPDQSEKRSKWIEYDPSGFDRTQWPAIPTLAVPRRGPASAPLDSLRHTLATRGEAHGRVHLLEMVFAMHVQREVEKIDAHYRHQFEWLDAQLRRARAQMRAVRATALQKEVRHAELWGHGGLSQHVFVRDALQRGEAGRRIQLACHEIFRMKLLLRDYCALNYIGFVKIMKKHDKISRWDASPRVLAFIRQRAFHHEAVQQRTWAFGRLGILIDELEDFYATSFMQSDRAAAQRALVVAAHATTKKYAAAQRDGSNSSGNGDGDGADEEEDGAVGCAPESSPTGCAPPLTPGRSPPSARSSPPGRGEGSGASSPNRAAAMWRRATAAGTQTLFGTSTRAYMVSDVDRLGTDGAMTMAEARGVEKRWWESERCGCARVVVLCCGCDSGGQSAASMCCCSTTKEDESRVTDFVLGTQIMALMISAILGALYLVYQSEALHGDSHFVRSFPAFRAPLLLSMHFLGFAIDVVAWHTARIDYVFLLGLDPHALGKTPLFLLFRLASSFVVAVAFALALFVSFGDVGSGSVWEWQRSWIALAVVLATLPIFISPWGCAKPWRAFLVKQLARIVCGAGACTTTFQASFIADQLCSQARLLTDLLYLACWFPSGAFLTRGDTTVDACIVAAGYTRVVASALPYGWRLLQCLRQVVEGVVPRLHNFCAALTVRRRDRISENGGSAGSGAAQGDGGGEGDDASDSGSGTEGSDSGSVGSDRGDSSGEKRTCRGKGGCCEAQTFKKVWIPIMNSGKYCSALLVVAASTWGSKEVWICAAAWATAYAFVWDTVADWGLLHVWQSVLTKRHLRLCCADEHGDDAHAATHLLAVSSDSLRDARRRSDEARARAVVASVIHESWRTTHLHPASGTYTPCIKEEGGVEYDIANLAFDALPPRIRAMNLATADAACAYIARSRDAGEDLASAKWMEAASANQFIAHRHQGSYVADSDYPNVESFDVMTRDHQEKYRAVVRIALRHYVADSTPRRASSAGLSMLERAQQFSAATTVAAAAAAAAADDADAETDDTDATIVAPPRLLRSVTAPAALRDMDGGGGSGSAERDAQLSVGTGLSDRGVKSGRALRESAATTAGIAAEARAELMLRAVKPGRDADARVRSPDRRRKWRPVLHDVRATEDDSFALGHALLRKKLLAPVWVYFAAIPTNLVLRLVWVLSISPGISAYLGSEFFVLLVALLEILRRCLWNFFRLEHAQVSNWEGFQTNRMTELGEAEELCRRTLYERHAVLGPDHSLTLTSLNNLGVVLHAQGKLSEAVPLLRSAMEKKQATEANDGTATLTVMTNLALLLEATGKIAEADVLLHRALRVYDETLGATHPSTLSFAHNLAELLQSHGESERAQPLFNRALLGTSEAWRVQRNDSSLRRIPWHLSSSAIEYTVQGLVV